jgi:hypothetical protein
MQFEVTKVYCKNRGQANKRSGQAEVSNPGQCHKVQNGRQGQGQGRQRSVIQGSVTRYRTADRLRAGRGL